MTNPRRRLRILLSAYACEPGKGSEPGNGWNWAKELSRYEDVWVLTRANNRPSIESAVAAHPLPNAHFVYLDLPRWARFWKKGSRGLRAYYYLWQVFAYRIARQLHREVRFEVIHHVSFATYVFPSFLSFLPVPFVWGPVGGGETIPASLAQSFGTRRRIDEFLRNLRRKLGELDPFVRRTAAKAVFIAATTADTQERLAALGRPDADIIPHAALCDEDLSLLEELSHRTEGPFRVLTVGRMVQFKAHDLGLRAFAKLLSRYPESEYWIVGDGPERSRLAKMARTLGIADRAIFLGALPRDEVFVKLGDCDVMLFPSLHDSSGWASIEAMAAGRPVVCLDLGGPALQVAEDRGIKVPADSMQQIVTDLGTALIRLADDPSLRMRLGCAARSYVREHHKWARVVQDFSDAYHRLLSSGRSTVRAAMTPSEIAEEKCETIPPVMIHP
jgi:glycosyltransferase involved in cell wall biosynthesis